jgi:AcrR family transcriptional regulator
MNTRTYNSPKREAQAQATREAILDAFVAQLSEGRDRISPSDAAERAGVSLRTVHVYFPNEDSQIVGVGEWLDRLIYPNGVELCAGPDDLVRYFRDIHRMALQHPVTRVLSMARSAVWLEVRQRRRMRRLNAIRDAVKAIGAPKKASEEATAMLLSLSGADASWPLVDHGLPVARAPDVIANTVQLVVDQLKGMVRK